MMRVLIVEDDEAVRDMLRLHLGHLGYEVEVAADGEAAWDLLQRIPVRLLVVDWMLPRLDGVQLIRRIRAGTALTYTYIILLTARNEARDRVKGLSAGADDYIGKPFNLDELQARLAVGERILKLETRWLEFVSRTESVAVYDPTTGLVNRATFLERARSWMIQVDQRGNAISAVLVDLKGFRAVNQQLGHKLGDMVLRLAAELIVSNLRPYDLVGRWNGDQFLLLLQNANTAAAHQLVERLRQSFTAGLDLPDGTHLHLQLHVGVSSLDAAPATEKAFEQLLTDAEQTLANARRRANECLTYLSTAAVPSLLLAGSGRAFNPPPAQAEGSLRLSGHTDRTKTGELVPL